MSYIRNWRREKNEGIIVKKSPISIKSPLPPCKGESAELDFKQILVTQKSSFIINGW